jgi:hypothetical protein
MRVTAEQLSGGLPPTQEGVRLDRALVNGVDMARLFAAGGDPNGGRDPIVTANVHTNKVAGATSTTQFVLDHGLNQLATLANNAGTLTSVAKITLNGQELDFDARAGFDITDASGQNTAYALLNVAGIPGL